MEPTPSVSIGMPVYNGARYIAEAIEAILEQTYSDFELIIADNASDDHTDAICRDYARRDSRIRFFRHETNLGAAANFNFVFQRSRGKYFKWTAHDDRIAPDFLEKCVSQLASGPASRVLAFPRRQPMRPDGTPVPPSPSLERFHSSEGRVRRLRFVDILRLPPDHFPTLIFGLIRSEALRRTRLFGAYPSADLVLVAELRMLGDFAETPEALYYQRRHACTSDWQARQSKRGEALWYKPDNLADSITSGRYLLLEHLRAISATPTSLSQKATAYLAMGSYVSARLGRRLKTGTLLERIREELHPASEARLYS